MAKLVSEKLKLQIINVVQYDTPEVTAMYERFNISINIDGKEAIRGVNGSYELCGNIEGLISILTKVINEESNYEEMEFMEPEFRFEVIKVPTYQHPFTKETIDDKYKIICWVNSGNWTGTYSATEIGCKFYVDENSVVNFRNGLQREWDKRKIEQY